MQHRIFRLVLLSSTAIHTWAKKEALFDFFKIMEASRVLIPKAQLDIMFENLPTAVNFIRTQGMIPEAWYDEKKKLA
jgi:hypothetical protein